MTGTNQGYVSEEHKRALEIAIPIFIAVNALLAVIGKLIIIYHLHADILLSYTLISIAPLVTTILRNDSN